MTLAMPDAVVTGAALGIGLAICVDDHDTMPLACYGSLEEIANAVDLLCSPQVNDVNGRALVVDGGFDSTGVGPPTLRRTVTA